MLQHWLLAARPKTLPVAMAPVIVGTALAWAEAGRVDTAVTAVILAAAILIQVGTNLHNDVADHERGADRPETRLGPPRATAEGWLEPNQVRVMAGLAFLAAAGLGGWLIVHGGWPIALIGPPPAFNPHSRKSPAKTTGPTLPSGGHGMKDGSRTRRSSR